MSMQAGGNEFLFHLEWNCLFQMLFPVTNQHFDWPNITKVKNKRTINLLILEFTFCVLKNQFILYNCNPFHPFEFFFSTITNTESVAHKV